MIKINKLIAQMKNDSANEIKDKIYIYTDRFKHIFLFALFKPNMIKLKRFRCRV